MARVTVQLTVAFSVPGKPTVSSVGIPLVGLNPQINTTGGTITGAQTLYYAFTALDASGAESGLSFTVPAIIPAATNTNQVTLISLSLSSTATGFNVYRGASPSELLQIATNVPVAVQFVDSGATATLKGPPDYNFDHANFYWRFELQPPEQATIQSMNTVGNSTLNMLAGDYDGATVWITGGNRSRPGADSGFLHADDHHSRDELGVLCSTPQVFSRLPIPPGSSERPAMRRR